jgi:hypothetical protein
MKLLLPDDREPLPSWARSFGWFAIGVAVGVLLMHAAG